MAKRATRNAKRQEPVGKSAARPPVRAAGILFGLLANLILVTLVSLLVAALDWSRSGLLIGTAVAAVIAGVLTARYIGARAGIHAFLGGMLSIPLLGLIAFGGDWQAAFFGGAFCALGGILMEKFSSGKK
ncbi:MAG: hypothetical protein R2911_37800 [Caldilineaceae bacterium]